MTMGQIIKKLRKERDLTQEELAEQLNITAQAVSRWESGTGMPDISQVVPLANAFGVSTDVLFGMQDQDADAEVERFIKEMEKKSCNRPETVSRIDHELECCNDVLEMLKVYPNHYNLLGYSMGHIVCLLDDMRHDSELRNKTDEIKAWENLCIRQGNMILNHCTDIRHLNKANKWLVELYRKMGNLEKAEEHANNMAVFYTYYEGNSMLAKVYDDMGRKEEAMKKRAENIFKALNYLAIELRALGHDFGGSGKQEEAYACYRLYPDIYDLMVGDKEDEMPYYLYPSYDYCAFTCMRLNKPDEAMEWLEKLVRHERFVAKNYNVITATKLPYFYGRELHYSKNVYSVNEKITPVLAWKAFDPIRKTDRFKAILADAEAFERGE